MLDKTFNPAEIEARQYPEWENSGVFAAQVGSNQQPFTIMMPPPNVTGSLHMGHGLNMTLQDILTRYNRAKGRDALWMPGVDHAGIATQMVVERQLDGEGIKRRDMGREAFLKRVWEWKAYSGGTITSQLRRLGTTPDWNRERFTMDDGMSKAVIKAFVQLHSEGLIYRDKRLVNWDPKFRTAISDIEVEQREVKGHLWHIQYAVEGDTARTITVATTRPETMLGDTAIAVNPKDERYQDLIGKMAVVPIADRLIPIIADDYADPEHGSGAVKITPAHDFNDFEVGQRHNLPKINILDDNAHLNENVPEEYQGMERFAARKKILAELEELEILEKVENITHMVPHGDRSGVVIEPYLTDQWYVDAKTLAAPAIEAARSGKTKFVPQNWEKTYYEWMENIQPWCISRQLWWGHQIPAWYDEDGKVYVAMSEEEAQKQAGADKKLTRDEDVLDTWFSSAMWPFSTLGWPEQTPELAKYYPGDTLVTGFDIIFFWVARMMMMGMHFMGDVPFKTVYIHALVRDAKGQKMSKSKGNVIDPLDLIDKFGADALRFTMTAMAAQGRDIRLSEDRVEGYRNFATKLWNATRFCEMNDAMPRAGFDPASVTHTMNKWIVGEVAKTTTAIEQAMEAYKFNEAANAIYQFVWGSFCDWYLEFTKPLLASGDDALKEEIRGTTGWVLEQILRLLNPFMPFITEEIFANIAKRDENERLLTSAWPQYPASFIHESAATEVSWVTKFITEIRSVRSDMNVPAGAKIVLLVKDASAQTQSRIKEYEPILKQMARLSEIQLSNETAAKGSIQCVVDEATLIMPIADIIDLDKERERLQKQIAKLEDDIRKVDQKLENKQFVDNAPAEILEEHRERKVIALETLDKLTTALKQLA
jgi:valyl-tRNA synthetase